MYFGPVTVSDPRGREMIETYLCRSLNQGPVSPKEHELLASKGLLFVGPNGNDGSEATALKATR